MRCSRPESFGTTPGVFGVYSYKPLNQRSPENDEAETRP